MKFNSLLLTISFFLAANAFAQESVTFNFTGAVQTYTVPSCVTSIDIVMAGAKGGGLNGGNGATVSGTISVVPGQVLEIYVGGTGGCPAAGFNGGGLGTTATGAGNEGCGGGGASDIRIAPFGLDNRIMVAAGGGGMGGGDTDALAGIGGCDSGSGGESPLARVALEQLYQQEA